MVEHYYDCVTELATFDLTDGRAGVCRSEGTMTIILRRVRNPDIIVTIMLAPKCIRVRVMVDEFQPLLTTGSARVGCSKGFH